MGRWTRHLLVLAMIGMVAVILALTVFRAQVVPVSVRRVDRGRVEDTVVNFPCGHREVSLSRPHEPGRSLPDAGDPGPEGGAGPPGSGKSTLLNILGPVDRPTAGRHELDGRETSTLSECQFHVRVQTFYRHVPRRADNARHFGSRQPPGPAGEE
jgi:hypothetical protein